MLGKLYSTTDAQHMC